MALARWLRSSDPSTSEPQYRSLELLDQIFICNVNALFSFGTPKKSCLFRTHLPKIGLHPPHSTYFKAAPLHTHQCCGAVSYHQHDIGVTITVAVLCCKMLAMYSKSVFKCRTVLTVKKKN